MSNTNNNLQTQTSSDLHNAIMEAGGKDRPQMLTPEEIRKKVDAEAKAIQIILTRIDNDIYSIVDACPNAIEIWKAIEGKSIANSPPPIYDPGPKVVDDDEASSKKKEIDKLMALISMSFKKIYKPTNNILITSSNTRNMNVDNTPRTKKGTGYN
ncbi:hypothetical protein Tco_0703395 [Tanacetum coccineum]|uniref:Uncharacterized protein n=1 Tax=Tanacetum coccineum TaxID=301880 RepID=A0ABQ4XYP9_9ASTR